MQILYDVCSLFSSRLVIITFVIQCKYVKNIINKLKRNSHLSNYKPFGVGTIITESNPQVQILPKCKSLQQFFSAA